MDKNRVYQIKKQFDRILHSNQEAHIEFWYARDLMPLLGYERWENFDKEHTRKIISFQEFNNYHRLFSKSHRW